MVKIILYFIPVSLIFSFFYFGTSNNLLFKREVINVSKEVFFAKSKQISNDTLINAMIPELNKAFELSDISKSSAQYEVRVYFFNAYGELFFRQSFTDGKTEANVYNCGTVKRHDSLFMQINKIVKLSGQYQYDKSFDFDNISKYTAMLDTVKRDGVTDDGAMYLIQLKRKDDVNYILIDNPFDSEEANYTAKLTCNYIRQLRENFTFKFHDPIAKVIDSAFIKPYGIESNIKDSESYLTTSLKHN
jgi:hypothetical protein